MKISFHFILEISIKFGEKRRNLQYSFDMHFYVEAAVCNMNFSYQFSEIRSFKFFFNDDNENSIGWIQTSRLKPFLFL